MEDLPVNRPQELDAEENLVDATATEERQGQTPLDDTSKDMSRSCLAELFDSDESEKLALSAKIDRLLENQKVLFSLMSRVLGELSYISRTQGLGVGFTEGRKHGGDDSLGWAPDLLLGGGQGEIHPDWSHEGELEPLDSPSAEIGGQFQSTVDDSILSQVLDGGEEGDVFLEEAMKIKSGSCSMGNFAVELLRRIFSSDELVNRNCRGSRGKEALDTNKLRSIKEYCFKLYPTPPGCKEQQ